MGKSNGFSNNRKNIATARYKTVMSFKGGQYVLYTTYYAESNSITEERYQEMKRTLVINGTRDLDAFHLRKLEFLGSGQQKAIARYFLCVKSNDENQIFLEKKYIQNGLHYKKCTKITKEECQKIMAGDLEWMKNHRGELLADFYRQTTLNNLYPGRVTDYQREMYRCRKGEYVTFTTSIERGVGQCRDLFGEPEMKISCLDEGKVLVIYKKSATLPQIVSSMLQGQEGNEEEYAFVF